MRRVYIGLLVVSIIVVVLPVKSFAREQTQAKNFQKPVHFFDLVRLHGNTIINGTADFFSRVEFYRRAIFNAPVVFNDPIRVDRIIFEPKNMGTLDTSDMRRGTIFYDRRNQRLRVWTGNDWFTTASQDEAAYNAGDGITIDDHSISTEIGSTVNTNEIVNGTIENVDIGANAGIDFSKLDIIKSDIVGLGIPEEDTDTTYTAGTGLSLVGTTFSSLLGTAIDTSEIVDGTIEWADLNSNGCAADQLLSYSGTEWHCVDAIEASNPFGGSIESNEIEDDAIMNADVNANAGIDFSKLDIIKSDIVGLGIPEEDTDTTYTAGTGLSLVGTTFSSLLGIAVDTSEIVDGTIVSDDLADSIITSGKILDDTITTTDIATNGVATAEIVDDTISASDIAATLTFGDGDFLDLSAINMSSLTEGLKMPQTTDCSSATAEGLLCWDTDDDIFYIGTGSSIISGGNPFGSTINSAEILDDTIVAEDIVNVTRSITIPLGSLINASTGLPLDTSSLDVHPDFAVTGNQMMIAYDATALSVDTSYVTGQIVIPQDYASGGTFIVMVNESSASGATESLDLETTEQSNSSSADTSLSTNSATNLTATTNNQIVSFDRSTGLAAGMVVGFQLAQGNSSANDTVNILSIEFQYTATQ